MYVQCPFLWDRGVCGWGQSFQLFWIIGFFIFPKPIRDKVPCHCCSSCVKTPRFVLALPDAAEADDDVAKVTAGMAVAMVTDDDMSGAD